MLCPRHNWAELNICIAAEQRRLKLMAVRSEVECENKDVWMWLLWRFPRSKLFRPASSVLLIFRHPYSSSHELLSQLGTSCWPIFVSLTDHRSATIQRTELHCGACVIIITQDVPTCRVSCQYKKSCQYSGRDRVGRQMVSWRLDMLLK